jgi:hypothetical protein
MRVFTWINTVCTIASRCWSRLGGIRQEIARGCPRGHQNVTNGPWVPFWSPRGHPRAIGGMAAQDAMKVCIGKFTPVHQYFTFDAIDCWPPTDPTEKNSKATGSRYDG